jgi:hypothetical protein
MTSIFLPATISPCCFIQVLMPARNSSPTLANGPENGAITPTLTGCCAVAATGRSASDASASNVPAVMTISVRYSGE